MSKDNLKSENQKNESEKDETTSQGDKEYRDFYIYKGDWFYINFAHFASEAGPDREFVRERLTKPLYKVSETDATYRAINNWDTNGLLFENKERENGWRKFSLTELVWIHILGELRKIGFRLETLKKLRDDLFMRHNQEKGDFFTTMELSFFISAVLSKQDVILVADSEGRGAFCLTQEYLSSQVIRPLPASYSIVNINKIIARVTNKPKFEEKNTNFFVLDDKTVEIKSKMMFDDISEINIKVRDGEMDRINYKSHIKEPEEAINQVRDLLKDGKMKTVTLYQDENGKVVSIMKEEKT